MRFIEIGGIADGVVQRMVMAAMLQCGSLLHY